MLKVSTKISTWNNIKKQSGKIDFRTKISIEIHLIWYPFFQSNLPWRDLNEINETESGTAITPVKLITTKQ